MQMQKNVLANAELSFGVKKKSARTAIEYSAIFLKK